MCLKEVFGSSVLEFVEQNNINLRIKRIGWPDKFIPHGNSPSDLRKSFGLDFESIFKKAEEFLQEELLNSCEMIA